MKRHFCAILCFAALLGLGSLSARAADVLTPGFLKLSLYTNIAGVAVADFTSDAKYPANPDDVRYLRSLNTRDALPTDALDDYGGRIEGFLAPLESGDYNFFLRSDSQSELYLSTDDTEAAAVLIAEQINNGRPFLETEDGDVATTQSPITLAAGTKYFIEVLYKGKSEGDGPDTENQTDFAQVAWRKVGDPTPAADLKPIPGAFLSTLASSAGSPAVSFTQNPANVTVAENAQTTFTVAVNTSPADPVSIQWQRNGVNIPGATGPSFTTFIDKADNGVPFRAVASVPGAVANSTAATVTVTPADTTKPTLVSALGGPNRPTVTLTFSERISTATAEDPANYQITAAGGTLPNVTGAVLSADRTAVTLQLDAQGSIGTNYTVTVNNVADLAVPTPNVIVANSKATFLPRGPSLEGDDGFIVFEVEDYDRNSIDSTTGVKWFADSERGVASGGISMVCPWGTSGVDEHHLLEYDIYFTKVGTHYIWVRASADNGNSDSCYVHLDGVRQREGNLSVLTGVPTVLDSTYDWAGVDNDSGAPMFVNIPGPGVHTIGFGPREQGFFMDKCVITSDPAFVPTDFGPPVTARQTQVVTLSTDFGILTQPVDTTGPEHGSITVTAGVLIPQAAYTLQWQRKNGAAFEDISSADTTGATTPSLTISPLTMGWNGAVVRLKMTSGGKDKFSNEVKITVIPDTTRPNLLGANGLATLNRVRLRYSEPVDATTAQTTGNYQITGPNGTLAVTSATLLSGQRTVDLITAAQTVGQKYTVKVSNVRDLAFTPNVIDQNQAKFYSLGALQPQGSDGLLVFEAESYDRNLADDWTEDDTRFNPSGGVAMVAPDGSEMGSQLEYDLTFTKTGTNILWWRASAIDGVSDSAWFHVDGDRPPNRTDANLASLNIEDALPDYVWFYQPQDGGGQMTFDIATAGVHTIGIGMREHHAFYDKFLITTDPAFDPNAYGPYGPPESRAGQPALPTLAITAPANSAQFNEGDSIPITVSIGATTRVIAKVEYFSDGNKIGESTSSPYNFTWPSAPAGTHDLTATLTDDVNATVNSPAVTVAVNAAQGITLTATMAPNGLVLTWTGGTAPYTVQQKATLADAWVNVLTTDSLTATFPTTGQSGFFRVGSE